jgi:surface polysaccharide O-acyltransferase-like enzyme
LKPRDGNHLFYIDLLRCVAAFAVITIHVLGPLRYLLGQVRQGDWLAAVAFNASSRWAVPVFLLITGTLMLGDSRPFNLRYYLKSRLARVFLPFVLWSFLYALLGGFNDAQGNVSLAHYDTARVASALRAWPHHKTWYHLGFFYYFIPVCFAIPLLRVTAVRLERHWFATLLAAWMAATLVSFVNDGTGSDSSVASLILYSGYPLFGHYLSKANLAGSRHLWIVAGLFALGVNVAGTWYLGLKTGSYSSAFMHGTTLNTVLAAAMVFVVCRTKADGIPTSLKPAVSLIAKHSLGIYLIHPLFLTVVRNLDNGVFAVFGPAWLAIPLWSVVVMGLSLAASITLQRVPVVRQLAPC